MQHKKMLLVSLFVLLGTMFFAGQGDASIGDMPFGTSITNNVSVKYTDAIGVTTFDTNDNVNTTVTGIAGDTTTTPSDGAISGAGGADTIAYTLYNTGNRAETYAIWVNYVTYDGAADSWDFQLGSLSGAGSWVNDVDSGSYSGAGGTIYLSPVSEDATATFILVIRTAAEQVNSPDGSSGTFVIAVKSSGADSATSQIAQTTEYTGDNDTVYAEGDMNDTDKVAATITAPLITVTKTLTTVATNGGAANGVVIPGASLTYTVNINNTGNGAGKNVIVFDTIPYTTNPGDLVEFDSMALGDSWIEYWATDANASRTYVGAADTIWVSYAVSTPAAKSIDTGTVRFIKWESASYIGKSNTSPTFVVTVN